MAERPISLANYALRVGKSPKEIYRAIESGRLVNGYKKSPKGRGITIFPEIADKELAETYNPAYGGTLGKPEGEEELKLNEIKQRLELAKMELMEMELAEKKNELVRRDAVYSELFKIGQEMREKLLSVPDRIIDDLMASADRNEAHSILQGELHRLLTELTNDIKKSAN